MEYADLVTKIVAAEHQAREIARQAKEREDSLEEDLKKEAAQLHDSYMARAKHRIEEVTKAESAFSKESIADLDKKHAAAMAAVETVYEKNKELWVDTLFHKIVGEAV